MKAHAFQHYSGCGWGAFPITRFTQNVLTEFLKGLVRGGWGRGGRGPPGPASGSPGMISIGLRKPEIMEPKSPSDDSRAKIHKRTFPKRRFLSEGSRAEVPKRRIPSESYQAQIPKRKFSSEKHKAKCITHLCYDHPDIFVCRISNRKAKLFQHVPRCCWEVFQRPCNTQG